MAGLVLASVRISCPCEKEGLMLHIKGTFNVGLIAHLTIRSAKATIISTPWATDPGLWWRWFGQLQQIEGIAPVPFWM